MFPSPLSPSQLLTQKARAALDVGRPKEAIPLLLQALGGVASGREGAYVMCHLSKAFGEEGEHETALLWADRALAAAPDDEWAHRLRAFALDKGGRTSEALGAACMARALRPDVPNVYYLLARLYIKRNDYERALHNARRYRELAPEDADAYYYLADIALTTAERNKTDEHFKSLLWEAEKYLHDGLALDPVSPFLHRLMGKLRELQNRTPEALAFYVEAARQLPTSEYEQENVRTTLYKVLTWGKSSRWREMCAFGACCFWQGAAGWLHKGAWAAYGTAVFLSAVVGVCAHILAPYTLFFHKPLRRLNSSGKRTLMRAAEQRRRDYLKRGKFIGDALLVALVLNLPPLLLRGLWNAGVWAFHAYLRHG